MKYIFFISLSALGLVACAQSSVGLEKKLENREIYGATIGIVNHTNKYIYYAAVDSEAGGHADRLSAGVGSMCCAVLPMKWHPSLKVKVDWDMPDGTTHINKSKIVDVEKYDEPGTIYLHFFPNDEIRVVVTNWVGGSSHHPIPPPSSAMTNRL